MHNKETTDEHYISWTAFFDPQQILYKVPVRQLCPPNETQKYLAKSSWIWNSESRLRLFTLQRILIRSSFISTTLSVISSTLYIVNTFQGQLTGKLAMSLMLFFGCVQIFFKTLSLRYNRNNSLKLLRKVQPDNVKNNELKNWTNWTKILTNWKI